MPCGRQTDLLASSDDDGDDDDDNNNNSSSDRISDEDELMFESLGMKDIPEIDIRL